ncbi:unnamed protein product [Closterium sp. NIES-54]
MGNRPLPDIPSETLPDAKGLNLPEFICCSRICCASDMRARGSFPELAGELAADVPVLPGAAGAAASAAAGAAAGAVTGAVAALGEGGTSSAPGGGGLGESDALDAPDAEESAKVETEDVGVEEATERG